MVQEAGLYAERADYEGSGPRVKRTMRSHFVH